MMYVMSVQEEVFLKTDVTVSITLWIVLKNVVVQLHQMYVESVTDMVSQKVIAIVKVKNLIVHSNVVETLLSMDVESVTDQEIYTNVDVLMSHKGIVIVMATSLTNSVCVVEIVLMILTMTESVLT